MLKQTDLINIANQLILEGNEKEVPLYVLKKHIARYVSYDKYRMKYLLETLIEIGYFEWVNPNHTVLRLNDGWYK